jgi:uncharacterized protein (DUF1810 family)
MDDVYNLKRFVAAQHPVYDRVIAELRAGQKQSHWMWFIFPQIAGLGHSDLAKKFAIPSLDEADAYLRHPVLGTRLRECSRLVADIGNPSVEQIFGTPDHMKFHSSMTLFAQATEENGIFRQCLDKYFAGEMDSHTLTHLAR